ncbi:MAG: proteasome subunit alpha [Candidatus Poribacteria bacterium]|nr:proteasome subunit alpha [Candidatus Poribacteria bacterium]
MSTPYYVSPEQIWEDKKDFVRRGIEQAKEVVALEYKDGLLMVAENPRRTTFKISEIYDKIALASTGRVAEYEALRVAGIRESEVKGFTYYREDVTGKWLTNLYSQHMGAIAQAWDAKPLEIELLVCEVDGNPAVGSQIYYVDFDGTYHEEEKFAVIGGRAETITDILKETYTEGLELSAALQLASRTLERVEAEESEPYQISPQTIEVACLDATAGRRKFRRFSIEDIAEIFNYAS